MQCFKDIKLQRGIIKTLAYSDIFDYPLTSREVWRFLISDNQTERKTVQKQLKILTDLKRIDADTDGEFYFLEGRNKIAEARKKREEWSREKLTIVQRTVKKLKVIPTIKMIGITGALAMNNCKEGDDIDLLIVTSTNSLWLTRFLILTLCPILEIRRRKPSDTEFNNKICFNLFLEEGHLKIEQENLFLAHEIAQVKPIFDKGGIYGKFIGENKWVGKYLANATNSAKCKVQSAKSKLKVQSLFTGFLNKLAFMVQYLYMKPKMTIEKVSFHQAFFHPHNLQKTIQARFEQKLSLLGLDKGGN